MGIDENTP